MTAVEKYFFTPRYYPRSDWSVIQWWESRRLLFNLFVGGAHLGTFPTVDLPGGPRRARIECARGASATPSSNERTSREKKA